VGEDGRVAGGENNPTPDNSFASPDEGEALYVMGKSGIVEGGPPAESLASSFSDVTSTTGGGG